MIYDAGFIITIDKHSIYLTSSSFCKYIIIYDQIINDLLNKLKLIFLQHVSSICNAKVSIDGLKISLKSSY